MSEAVKLVCQMFSEGLVGGRAEEAARKTSKKISKSRVYSLALGVERWDVYDQHDK